MCVKHTILVYGSFIFVFCSLCQLTLPLMLVICVQTLLSEIHFRRKPVFFSLHILMPVPVEQSHTNNNKNKMEFQRPCSGTTTYSAMPIERSLFLSFCLFLIHLFCFTCTTFDVCVPFFFLFGSSEIDELYVQVLSCLHTCTL